MLSSTLTHISISNFKPFRGQVEIPLRKVTLLYGPNSAGKSSIIQAIKLYKQSSAADDPDKPDSTYTPRLHPTGDLLDASSIEHITHNQEKRLPIGLAFHATNHRKRRSTYSGKYKDGNLVEAGFKIEERNTVKLDATFIRQEQKRGRPLWVEAAGNPGLRAFLAQRGVPASKIPARPKLNFTGFERLHFDAYAHNSIPSAARGRLTCLLCDVGMDVWNAVAATQFLSPIRKQPARTPTTVLDDGQDVWVGSTGERILEVLYHNPDKVARLNQALQKLGMPYKATIERPVSGAAFKGLGVLALRPTRGRANDVLVYAPDVGFGVGQVLPILVSGVAGDGELICVEQPELHLHPRLQGDLADFILETSAGTESGQGQRWLLETHSESLMLRIQRRIREGHIAPNDISVLYVEPMKEGHSLVRRLELGESGNFLDPWPSGFFEERLQELP